MNRRILAFAAVMTTAFCPWKATVAQSVGELRVALVPSRTRPLEFRDELNVHIDTQPANSEKPSLLRHVVYGAGAGLVGVRRSYPLGRERFVTSVFARSPSHGNFTCAGTQSCEPYPGSFTTWSPASSGGGATFR